MMYTDANGEPLKVGDPVYVGGDICRVCIVRRRFGPQTLELQVNDEINGKLFLSTTNTERHKLERLS